MDNQIQLLFKVIVVNYILDIESHVYLLRFIEVLLEIKYYIIFLVHKYIQIVVDVFSIQICFCIESD